MRTRIRTGRAARGLIALAAMALPLMLTAGPPALAAPEEVIWLRVEANDLDGGRQKVKVNIPLSLIEVVVDSIDKREFMGHLESGHPGLDIPKLWRELRNMEGDDFVTVESEKEHVRVWKDNEFFRISVKEEAYAEPNIEVRLPLAIMDYLFESKSREIDFQELVDQLRGHLPLTLLTAKHEDGNVKIWLTEE